MTSLSRKLSRLSGATAIVVGVLALYPGVASASSQSTCYGGSIAGGTYSSLVVSGLCAVDSGDVVVQKNVTVLPGAGLNAAFAGSNLTVGGNLLVHKNGILVLGCEPDAFTCFNDQSNTQATDDSVGGNLVADGALMMLVHHNTINGNLSQSGGGGGVNCDTFPLGPDGPPAYSTYEDNSIGKNASITGVRTCWLGFIRNSVSRNANYNNNVTADPDGNEVVTNTIIRNLNCSENSPAPQAGDSGGSPNAAARITGQCATEVF